jgi:hypothetical protein
MPGEEEVVRVRARAPSMATYLLPTDETSVWEQSDPLEEFRILLGAALVLIVRVEGKVPAVNADDLDIVGPDCGDLTVLLEG